MNDRKQEILQIAIGIIADEGYGSLSMRALARASGIKLGALQYHFRTWDALLRGLVDYIAQAIREAFEARGLHKSTATVADMAAFGLDENAGTEDLILSDQLWPQLWAMEQVEPLVSDLLEAVYAEYIVNMERAMVAAGSESPHAEALALMSMLEGESLFTGKGRRWEGDRDAVHETILKFIAERYGEKS